MTARDNAETEERLHFNAVAGLYDSARPGYPSLLFDDLLHLTEATPGAAVLDIGCGTGKSAAPLAGRGLRICALDPGDAMLALCRRNLAAHKQIEYLLSSFEDWDPAGRRFDLVVSGTAFHWVSDTAHHKLAEILRGGGHLGIFWQTFLRGKEPLDGQIASLYQGHGLTAQYDDSPASLETFDRHREEQVLSLAGFDRWRVIRYYDTYRYRADRYVDLMKTWSTHRHFGEEFFHAVAQAITRAGGEIDKPVRTTLCLARAMDGQRR